MRLGPVMITLYNYLDKKYVVSLKLEIFFLRRDAELIQLELGLQCFSLKRHHSLVMEREH